jgi:hypothetical protein
MRGSVLGGQVADDAFLGNDGDRVGIVGLSVSNRSIAVNSIRAPSWAGSMGWESRDGLPRGPSCAVEAGLGEPEAPGCFRRGLRRRSLCARGWT